MSRGGDNVAKTLGLKTLLLDLVVIEWKFVELGTLCTRTSHLDLIGVIWVKGGSFTRK